MSNPYLESWRNRRVNRRIKEQAMPVFVKLLPVLAVGAAAPFVSPVFLAVSEQGYSPSTVSGLAMRLGWLVCAAMSLHTYTAVSYTHLTLPTIYSV